MVMYADRLDFALKSFVRIGWGTVGAEKIWSPRFKRVRSAVLETEWTSVTQGIRGCALLQLSTEELDVRSRVWPTKGLVWKELKQRSTLVGAWWLDAYTVRAGDAHIVVVGTGTATEALVRAWAEGDHNKIGDLLGYPDCCRMFFEDACIGQRCIDTVWAMSQGEPEVLDSPLSRSIIGPPTSNIFLQSLGIRAVPHCPCRFGCRQTERIAIEMAAVATKLGLEEEYEWLSSILSWPAEWSALHGIAEVRNPILRICVPTDATASKYVVRWNGRGYPDEAAKGSGFPYSGSASKPTLVRLDP